MTKKPSERINEIYHEDYDELPLLLKTDPLRLLSIIKYLDEEYEKQQKIINGDYKIDPTEIIPAKLYPMTNNNDC